MIYTSIKTYNFISKYTSIWHSVKIFVRFRGSGFESLNLTGQANNQENRNALTGSYRRDSVGGARSHLHLSFIIPAQED